MLFLLVLLVPFSLIQESAEECNSCYSYQGAPGNNSNLTVSEGLNVTLSCAINTPRPTNSTSMVKWFKKTELTNQEDIFNSTGMTLAKSGSELSNFCTNSSDMRPIYQDIHMLVIKNFNHNDSGIYRCQIINESEDICFGPSESVNIAIDTVNEMNQIENVIVYYKRDPICAKINDSLCHHSAVTATPPQQTISSTLSTKNNTTTQNTHSTQLSPSQLNLCNGELNIQNLEFVACLGVTIPAVGLVLILVVNIICCIGICLCWRKQKRKAMLNITEIEGVSQNATHNSSEGNQALNRKERAHQYEDVESPQAQTSDKEDTSDCQQVPTSSKLAETRLTTTNQGAVKGAFEIAESEKNPTDVHMYEQVTLISQDKLTSYNNQQKQSKTESKNSWCEDVIENKVLKKTDLLSSQNESSSDNQYSVLDRGLSNPVKKAEGDEDAAEEGLLYSKPHTFSFTASSSHEQTVEENEYQNTGQARIHTLSQKHRQNSVKKHLSAGDHEYHALEEVIPKDTTLSASPKYDAPFDTDQKTDLTKAPQIADFGKEKPDEFQETGFGPIIEEEGQERVFDDPQYNIGQQKSVVNEPAFLFDDITAERSGSMVRQPLIR